MDADGLPDEFEAQGWNVTVAYVPAACGSGASPPTTTYSVFSNPASPDNDSDGLTDDAEYSYGTDPNRADTDGDNLSDGLEWRFQDAHVFLHSGALAATQVDSDEDCLTDWLEAAQGVWSPGLLRWVWSDPTTSDGDLDGFSDYREFFELRTDPRSADSDGDGARDNFDVDPRRDVAIEWRFVELGITRHPTGATAARLAYDGGVQGISFASATPLNASVGAVTPLPGGTGSGLLDVSDLGGGTFLFLSLVWSDGDGSGYLYDLAPGAERILRLRYHVANDTWAYDLGASAYGPEGRDCRAAGDDGFLRFEIRVGDASQDFAAIDPTCDAEGAY